MTTTPPDGYDHEGAEKVRRMLQGAADNYGLDMTIEIDPTRQQPTPPDGRDLPGFRGGSIATNPGDMSGAVSAVVAIEDARLRMLQLCGDDPRLIEIAETEARRRCSAVGMTGVHAFESVYHDIAAGRIRRG